MLVRFGGRIGLVPFNTMYHASKFALEGFTESLRHELAEFNIDVILINPELSEAVLWIILGKAKNYDSNKSPYAKSVQKLFEGFEPMIANSSDPKEVAQVILNAANSSSPNVRYAVGKDAESVSES